MPPAILSLVAGCAERRRDGRTSSPSVQTTGVADGEESLPVRLAAHEFVPVGATRELGNLGDLLEVIEFDGRLELSEDERTFTCRESGVACIRARYRHDDSQNEVQTKCVIGIADTGSCSAHEPASFDLQQYANRPGDSNLLASGAGEFYRVCDTGDGLRLEQPDRDLPPLYFQLVDATADGPYAISPDEYGQQR